MAISEKIKSLRLSKQLEAKELDSKLGFGEGSIEAFEQGGKEPTLKELMSLAGFFKVTTDVLLGVADEKEKKGIPDFSPLSLLGGLAMPAGLDLDNLSEDDDEDCDEELAMQLMEMTAAIDAKRKSREG